MYLVELTNTERETVGNIKPYGFHRRFRRVKADQLTGFH